MIVDKASLQSKWLSSNMHPQITIDAHNLFVVMISFSGSQVLVRTQSSFQSAEIIRAALHMARLLEMLFIRSGIAGHWDFVDLEQLKVSELLVSCVAVIVSAV